MYRSGGYGGKNGRRKEEHGVVLTEKNYIARAARPPEFTGDGLLKVTPELRGRVEAVTFVVA